MTEASTCPNGTIIPPSGINPLLANVPLLNGKKKTSSQGSKGKRNDAFYRQQTQRHQQMTDQYNHQYQQVREIDFPRTAMSKVVRQYLSPCSIPLAATHRLVQRAAALLAANPEREFFKLSEV